MGILDVREVYNLEKLVNQPHAVPIVEALKEEYNGNET